MCSIMGYCDRRASYEVMKKAVEDQDYAVTGIEE